MTNSATLDLEVEDFTGSMRHRVSGVDRFAMIGDLVNSLAHDLGMPDQDEQGRPIVYGVSRADGETLNGSDLVGEVLAPEERVTLTKVVSAG